MEGRLQGHEAESCRSCYHLGHAEITLFFIHQSIRGNGRIRNIRLQSGL